MHTVLSIVNITACLVISLACGIVMGRKRKEVNDRSTAWLQQVRLPELNRWKTGPLVSAASPATGR
jgi:hypothetical protein